LKTSPSLLLRPGLVNERACLRSGRSTRWSGRYALTWSGSSTSIPQCCTIFGLTSSKILLDPDFVSHGSPPTGADAVHAPGAFNVNSGPNSIQPTTPHLLLPQDASVIPSPSIPAYPSSLVHTAEAPQGCSGHPKSVQPCIPLLARRYRRGLQVCLNLSYIFGVSTGVGAVYALGACNVNSNSNSIQSTTPHASCPIVSGRSGHPKSVHPCIPLLAHRYCGGLSSMLRSSEVRPFLHTPPCPSIPRRLAIPSPFIPAYPPHIQTSPFPHVAFCRQLYRPPLPLRP